MSRQVVYSVLKWFAIGFKIITLDSKTTSAVSFHQFEGDLKDTQSNYFTCRVWTNIRIISFYVILSLAGYCYMSFTIILPKIAWNSINSLRDT